MRIFTLTATAFRAVAAFEALTWAGLLIGMGFKYLINGNELGVHVFGPIHGGAFVVYVLLTLFAGFRLRWGVWPTLLALAASVPPMFTLVADWWLHRTGRLTPPERRASAERAPETVA